MKSYGIGIDIGGTKISMVIGTAKGRILARREIPTLKHRHVRACVQKLIQNLQLLMRETGLSKNQLRGIGIGIPGAVNRAKGIVPKSPHLQGWKNFPLRRVLTRHFGLPVEMTNDANAAVVGEKIFGAGRGKQHVIYITVSTGIGGGLIAHDRLIEGKSFVAGEIGHMTIVSGGNRCPCGQSGCLEAYASGTAIAADVRRKIRQGQGKSLVRRLAGKQVTAREIGLAARGGDRLALEAFQNAGHYLGIGIGSLLNLLNPEIVILGGGVFKSAPRAHWQAMMRSAKKHAWPEAYRAARIVRTSLGDSVGNLGALALVFMPAKSNDLARS